MSETRQDTHPYALHVTPDSKAPGSWNWTIRHEGRVLQRSDRRQPTEEKARREGLETIEKLQHGHGDRR
ncbi:hypothetical protein [Methylobacterium sp. Leaf117]|uniref:hypothetical protein n=1 Tax=Methylobacterium sp. Leaf117 TaxID=1736260 RepID=UPI000AD13B08|nr:hypothetical protein [Methylobacterium sp. Leaf117]